MKLMSTIFIASLLFASAALAAESAVIEMKSITYSPKKIEITAGDSVVWKNTSYTQHSATSNDDGKTFDTGLISPGKSSKAISFARPGDYLFNCSIHGKTMSGEIVVKAASK
jgi:plastocyanin